eukprot:CAMPEP_0202968856 /NCGR_PEP_ID=MMETSP1396-20130829/14339_1 /ASSEMBLY_ACC=CAM_ASM_000872 /TAXON_ID= /ORGANISM="Pseudokeronopsis sp., Strain Brazil" /LENGTH=70 /DNA_ID=CAMNT_0049695675 /DNA_START=117 /DNA_END=329 /DNA_ORIENTATION=-
MEQGTIHDPDTFASIEEPFFYYLADPVAEIFGLTEEEKDAMDYYTLYKYCDVLVSDADEGNPPRYEFSPI